LQFCEQRAATVKFVICAFMLLFALLSCVDRRTGGNMNVVRHGSTADRDLELMLRSPERKQRMLAFQEIEQRRSISGGVLSALVASFAFERVISIPGPPATSTRQAILLERFAPQSLPYVVAGLQHPDGNVRRNAAYTLGRIASRRAIVPLRSAIRGAFEKPAHAPPESAEIEAVEMRAMAQAYFRIDHRGAQQWIISQLAQSHDKREAEWWHHALTENVADGPRCQHDGFDTAVCSKRWRAWMTTHR
jgi:hypothetical protein